MGATEYVCRRCGRPMEIQTAKLEYLDNRFDVELPTCPQCGAVYVDETLVDGRMAEVEALLESK